MSEKLEPPDRTPEDRSRRLNEERGLRQAFWDAYQAVVEDDEQRRQPQEAVETSGFVEVLHDPALCVNGGKHVWDGPEAFFGGGNSASCSQCGRLAVDVDQWVAP